MLAIIKYCFLKTMANRIPFLGSTFIYVFYPLKGKKSIRRVILGFINQGLNMTTLNAPSPQSLYVINYESIYICINNNNL